jgi:hypothetical protein
VYWHWKRDVGVIVSGNQDGALALIGDGEVDVTRRVDACKGRMNCMRAAVGAVSNDVLDHSTHLARRRRLPQLPYRCRHLECAAVGNGRVSPISDFFFPAQGNASAGWKDFIAPTRTNHITLGYGCLAYVLC